MSTVKVTNVSPATTQQKLCEFFAICGFVRSVTIDPSTCSAVVMFESPDAGETAVMLTGAIIVDSEVIITLESVHPRPIGGEAPPPTLSEEAKSDSRSALEVVNAAIAAGYLKGEALVATVREKAKQVDTGRMTRVFQRQPKGTATKDQWMYRSLQPQWGIKPSW